MKRLLPCALLCAFVVSPALALAQAEDEPAGPALLDPNMAPDDPAQAASAPPPASDTPVPDEFADDPPLDAAVPERVGPTTPPGGVPVILGPNDARPRRTVQRRPLSPPRPPPPPLADSSMIVTISPRLNVSGGSGFEAALAAHRYVGSDAIASGALDLAFALPGVEWLFIGGRLGLRGRSWRNLDRDAAVATGGELMLTLQARYTLGRIFELGLLLAGGAGVIDLRVGGVASDQVVARFGFEAVLGFRIDDNFSFGPRVGWDYFQWENMNAWGDGLEMGGVMVGLALEGRQ